jgi:hypothetical protein
LSGFLAAIPRYTFGKVTRGRSCSAAHLAYQTILFVGRVALSCPIDRQRQFVRPLPRAKLAIVSQHRLHYGIVIYAATQADSSCIGLLPRQAKKIRLPIADN